MQTLPEKFNYQLHYITFTLYVRRCVIVKKVHTIMKFSQSCWLKPDNELNTMKSDNNHKTNMNFLKLMNNSCYGKTLQSKLKLVDVELIGSHEDPRTETNNYLCNSCHQFPSRSEVIHGTSYQALVPPYWIWRKITYISSILTL